MDLSSDPVVKNPPSNARNSGSIPGGETKIPCALGQLSPWTTVRESLGTAKKTQHSQHSIKQKTFTKPKYSIGVQN